MTTPASPHGLNTEKAATSALRILWTTCLITATLAPIAMANAGTLPPSEQADKVKAEEAREVRQLIDRVNEHWQSTHAAEEAGAFWHSAAYHTGNMEAYRLTGDPTYLDYSLRWAEHNGWQGARGTNPATWRKDYGETDEHVLFGDWQICFQTYADLYDILPDEGRIRRAREVMEYEMSTPDHDYWWWCDALYMVMPVMTKLYRITRNELYLDKLYEYLAYADSIMLDTATGLYYRDARYVYPAHTTERGLKDFWARGDGWVVAGLAKVLQDLPHNCRYRTFFEQRFKSLMAAVAPLQQADGYWTRSLMDPDQAPGAETSGTAFFAYGLLWGINNGLLPRADYLPVAEKAWHFLATTAVQDDGSVGFVQPIGDRAIPGQVIDARSTADFGVGAFLLAACEYVRFLEADSNSDRALWVQLAYRLAYPVLSNMARGELRKNMEVEVSPTWDGRDIGVTYMECFGRLMAGIAPWLSLPDDDTPEGRMRYELRELALQSYAQAVDPGSPDYLLWRKEGQPLVDAAYVAESFLRAYDALWLPLDDVTKARYVEEFTQMRRVDPPYTNWLLFSATIESFLARAGAPHDDYRINSTIRKMEEWYTGDGWYADGPVFTFDYYSSYVFHPMYLETLQALLDAGVRTRLDYSLYRARALERTRKFSLILERFISPEGTFPVFGRSIPYRLATLQPLALMAWHDQLPAGVSRAQVRCALTAVIRRMFGADLNTDRSNDPAKGHADLASSKANDTPHGLADDSSGDRASKSATYRNNHASNQANDNADPAGSKTNGNANLASSTANGNASNQANTRQGQTSGSPNFNASGFLTIGFTGHQPNIADWYTNNGSLYMTSLALLPLALPPSHPFWTDAPQPWTSVRAWSAQPFPKDHAWRDNITTHDLY